MGISFLRKQKYWQKAKITVFTAVVLFVCVVFAVLFVIPFVPKVVESKVVINVPQGSSMTSAANILKNNGIISSPTMFKVLGKIKKISVKAGDYAFEGSAHLNQVIERLDNADYGEVEVRVTIPEGSSLLQVADILDADPELLSFDRESFIQITNGKEGYLFPDTYQFLPNASSEEIAKLMEDTFNAKTIEIQNKLAASGRTLNEIVIMASLIEKESGSDPEEQKIVSGILWKRIGQGMALQVDAPFVYAIGKGSAELRTADLRADGPYNTYTRTGLTPTPIGNPGLSAMEAALRPQDSPYLFYLHGNDGVIRYGRTHNEHVANKRNYL